LHIPETTFILTHPVLNALVSADINWLTGPRGSITLSFCGVNVLNDDDCKTVPTLMQILAMRCYDSDGVVHARSIYRFKARRIHVTHGLCDAERPDKALHGLMLKFNVRGNRPESDKLGPVEQQVTMPDHLQPVFMVSLRYPPVWDATAASRNTTMVLVTQKTSTQPRAFDELFDIVHRFDMLSPENPKLHCEVPVATAEPAERGGCQAPRQAAPVPGSPPAADFHSDVPISKGCLLPVRRLPISVVLA